MIAAENDKDDRDDGRKDRTIDKEMRDAHFSSLSSHSSAAGLHNRIVTAAAIAANREAAADRRFVVVSLND
jgi:hypothetical protein